MRNLERIEFVESLRLRALDEMNKSPNILLLGESPPAKRFVYDMSSDYSGRGLRHKLRGELVAGADDEVLMAFLQN